MTFSRGASRPAWDDFPSWYLRHFEARSGRLFAVMPEAFEAGSGWFFDVTSEVF